MSRAVWVTRDAGQTSMYNIHFEKPLCKSGMYWNDAEESMFPFYFERITGFRLKPGEGPVKVRIEVKRVK